MLVSKPTDDVHLFVFLCFLSRLEEGGGEGRLYRARVNTLVGAYKVKTVGAKEESFVGLAVNESVGGAPEFAEVEQRLSHVVLNRFGME